MNSLSQLDSSSSHQLSEPGSESLDILSGLASGMEKLSERGTKRRAVDPPPPTQPPTSRAPSPKQPRRNSHLHPPRNSSNSVHNTPPVRVIQDWNSVLGDKHSGNRTTTATKVFKEVKQWYKQNKSQYRSKGRPSALLGDAMKMYFRLVASAFPNDFPKTEEERLNTILIHCSSKASESNRIRVPRCYRYEGDTDAKYGIANVSTAVLFFFERYTCFNFMVTV